MSQHGAALDERGCRPAGPMTQSGHRLSLDGRSGSSPSLLARDSAPGRCRSRMSWGLGLCPPGPAPRLPGTLGRLAFCRGFTAGRTLTYDTARPATTLTTPTTGANPSTTTTFTYDARGNRATTTDTGPTTGTVGHTYNQANQLTTLTAAAAAAADGTTTSYTYAATGLRATATTAAAVEQYTWDALAAVPLLLTDSTHVYLYGNGTTPLEGSATVFAYDKWELLDLAPEGAPIAIFGDAIWTQGWTDTGQSVTVPHPEYPSQRHRLVVYALEFGGSVRRFAAGEVSNTVWMFWVPQE